MAGGDLGQGTRLAALTGAWICFEDEAGQSLRPGRARTWAPRGRTPVTRVSGNAGRLSVAGMACLKPGRPGRFFYRVHVHRRRKGDRASMSEADYAALVTAAHRALNAPVVLVWDNLNTHRSQKMRQFTEANSDWLTVIRLPAYAPDLNAVEGAWSSHEKQPGQPRRHHPRRARGHGPQPPPGSIQRRPDLINALLGQTGLSLEPPPP